MKRGVIFLVLLCTPAVIFADPGNRDRHGRGKSLYAAEIESILDAEKNTVISDLTFGEIDNILGQISVPLQKEAYVRRSRGASMATPGLGQFKSGDPLSGALFLAGDIAAMAGTLVGLYFLLPSELQFDELNYFTTPVVDVKAVWESAKESITLVEALPSIGVAAAGTLIHHALKIISARHAAKLARENIENGTVTFEPKSSFVTGQDIHRLGIGMALGW